MDTIRIALGCTPTCIALKAISTTPIIGIDRRAANPRRTNHRRNGMKLSRRCSDTAARSLDHSVPARPADLTTLPQRTNSLPIKPCKASGGGWSVASDRENSNGREPLNAIPPCVTDQVGNRFDRQRGIDGQDERNADHQRDRREKGKSRRAPAANEYQPGIRSKRRRRQDNSESDQQQRQSRGIFGCRQDAVQIGPPLPQYAIKERKHAGMHKACDGKCANQQRRPDRPGGGRTTR